jgi:molybdopterin-guanine dinucleotide biosynthesis protein A
MGGGDKALIEIGGRALLDRVIDRLGPQVDGLILSASGDPARFAPRALPVVADPPGTAGAGPLAGVLAGMEAAAAQGARHVVTVAADTPFLPRDLVARLTAAEGGPVAVAATPGPDGALRRHPTCALWPVALAPDLRRALAEGARRVALVAEGFGCAVVPFDAGPPDPFFNVNTPADRAEAERIAARA